MNIQNFNNHAPKKPTTQILINNVPINKNSSMITRILEINDSCFRNQTYIKEINLLLIKMSRVTINRADSIKLIFNDIKTRGS